MINTVKENYTIAECVAAKSYSAGATNGAAVDLSKGRTAAFFLSVGTVGTDGTVDMKLQYSANNSDWTDEPAETQTISGYENSTSITQITAAGTAALYVQKPRTRYYRVVSTVAVAACVLGVVSVLGPLNHVSEG